MLISYWRSNDNQVRPMGEEEEFMEMKDIGRRNGACNLSTTLPWEVEVEASVYVGPNGLASCGWGKGIFIEPNGLPRPQLEVELSFFSSMKSSIVWVMILVAMVDLK